MRSPRLGLSLFLLLWPSCWGGLLSTRLGPLLGKEHHTPGSGRKYVSYTGIPYALPPIGDLRLRNPVSYGPWFGVLDATKLPQQCKQIAILLPLYRNMTMGDEDCLYLNIHVPKANYKGNLPVLVYIHGGAYRSGSGGPEEAPSNFMEEDVVLVTVQYRLGSLGFLSTEDERIPGNYGLKDQAMAIKWLYDNIDEFGGDPLSITVFGESAGGASTHFLISSPVTRDLLKGGISESGVLDAKWALATPGEIRMLTKRFSELVNCDFYADFLECLQCLSANELLFAEKKFAVWDSDPAVLFAPVIEVDNDGAFLTEDPRDIIVNKPFMTGITQGEGVFKTASLLNQDPSVLDEFIANIDEYLPIVLFMGPDAPPCLIKKIKNRYFKNPHSRESVISGLEKVFKESSFIYPMVSALQRHTGPTFAYLYDHLGENSLCHTLGPKKVKSNEPCHADEIVSLFNWSSVFPTSKGREEDRRLSRRMVRLWVNFAKYQNPTPDYSLDIWRLYRNGNIYHIKTNKSKMENVYWQDIVDFWFKIYENPTC